MGPVDGLFWRRRYKSDAPVSRRLAVRRKSDAPVSATLFLPEGKKGRFFREAKKYERWRDGGWKPPDTDRLWTRCCVFTLPCQKH